MKLQKHGNDAHVRVCLSDVSFDGNKYCVFDEGSREVNGIYASNCGELCGFGADFLVCRDGDKYLIVNAENGNEIERLYSSSVGQFKHANGRLIAFQDGSQIVIWLLTQRRKAAKKEIGNSRSLPFLIS